MDVVTAWFFAIADCSWACPTPDSSTLRRPTLLVQILLSAYFWGGGCFKLTATKWTVW